MRALVLGTALAFAALLAFLTLYVAIESGPDVLTVAALAVLAVIVFGIAGALTSPPDDRR